MAMGGDERSRAEETHRRNRAGWGAGAATGATVGLLWGLVSAGLGAVVAMVVGAVAGGVVGRWLVGKVSVEEWDPGGDHPQVGMHAPDIDTAPRER
jgi:outer membrane lipoprotein SlyB